MVGLVMSDRIVKIRNKREGYVEVTNTLTGTVFEVPLPKNASYEQFSEVLKKKLKQRGFSYG